MANNPLPDQQGIPRPVFLVDANGAEFSTLPTALDGVLDGVTQSNTISAAGVVLSLDTQGYEGGSFHITTNASSNSVAFEASNDNASWVGVILNSVGSTGSSPGTSSASAGMFEFGLTYRYIRARVSAYIGVSTTVVSCLKRSNPKSVGVYVGNAPNVYMAASATSGALNQTRISTGASGVIKSSGGKIYGYDLYNTNAAARYLQLYNKTTAGVPGTDTPVRTIPLGASGSKAYNINDLGIGPMGTGISWAITTDAAGATAGASGDIVGSVDYF